MFVAENNSCHLAEEGLRLGEASKVKYEQNWGKFPNGGGGEQPKLFPI